MDLSKITAAMTPEIRDNLAKAIEIGKWADGTKLTEQQLADSMKAVIAWDATHAEETDEPFKVAKGGRYKTAADMRAKSNVPTSDERIILTNNLKLDD
jgi:uncharacterized protein